MTESVTIAEPLEIRIPALREVMSLPATVTEITAELANYETARDKAAADLRALERKVDAQVGHDEASIFAVHQNILRDTAFTNKIRGWIVDERMTAAASLHRLLGEYTTLFSKTNDDYLKERLNDVRDVVIRPTRFRPGEGASAPDGIVR